MTKNQRTKFIVDKFDIIKKNVNYLNLFKTAQNMKVLTDKMVQTFDVHNDEFVENEKYDMLLNQLTDMGLYLLKDLVLETIAEGDEFYKEIENHFIDMLAIHEKNSTLEPFEEKLLNYPNTKLDVIESTQFHKSYSSCIDIYNMRSEKRGVLFLVNNINFQHQLKRCGAQFDKVYMISLYRQMGFTIYYFENLRTYEFNYYVDELIQDRYLYEVDCLVFALLTHGQENNEAIFFDENVIPIKDILYKFNDTYCPTLRGKPKIFLFPFCRGTRADFGVTHIQKKLETDGRPIRLHWADIIICYGSVDGYQTLRETAGGSWFIREFCQILANEAHEKDFEAMLYMVKENVMRLRPKDPKSSKENYLQTPSIVTIDFNKILYFNPGFFLQNDSNKQN